MMQRRNDKILITLLLFFIGIAAPDRFCNAQQRFQFSQYMFNGMVLNPAYAGADDAPSFTFYNRSQWSNVEGAPVTQTLTAHTLFPSQRVGAGLQILNDKIGVHKSYSISAASAYHLKTGAKSFLSLGIQAGFGHRRSDYGSLGGNSVNDPKIAGGIAATSMIELGAGLYYRSPTLHLGFSSPQLLPAKMHVNDTVTVNFKASQYFFFSKSRIPLSTSVTFEPGLLLKYFRGIPLSFDINANFIFHKVLTAGLSYRKKESLDFLLRAQVSPQLQIGYGYDFVIRTVSALSRASHEVMVNYQLKFLTQNISSPR